MTTQAMIGTFAGGFIFAFVLYISWGKLIDSFGPIGGWLAAGFIVGTCWTLNHGVGLIFQSGGAWVDMAFAVGVGGLAMGAASGASIGKAMPTVLNAILGGVLGGFVLSCLFSYSPPW